MKSAAKSQGHWHGAELNGCGARGQDCASGARRAQAEETRMEARRAKIGHLWLSLVYDSRPRQGRSRSHYLILQAF